MPQELSNHLAENGIRTVALGRGKSGTRCPRLLRDTGLNVTAFDTAQAFLESYDPRAPGCLVCRKT